MTTSLKMLMTSNKRSLNTYFAHCIITCLAALEVIAKKIHKQKSVFSSRTELSLGPPDREFKKKHNNNRISAKQWAKQWLCMRYNSWYISLPSWAKWWREMTKIISFLFEIYLMSPRFGFMVVLTVINNVNN